MIKRVVSFLALCISIIVFTKNSTADSKVAYNNLMPTSSSQPRVNLDGHAWMKMSNDAKTLYLQGYIDAIDSAIGFNRGIHYLPSDIDNGSENYYLELYYKARTNSLSRCITAEEFRGLVKQEHINAIREFDKLHINKNTITKLINKVDELYSTHAYMSINIDHMVSIANSIISNRYGNDEAYKIIEYFKLNKDEWKSSNEPIKIHRD